MYKFDWAISARYILNNVNAGDTLLSNITRKILNKIIKKNNFITVFWKALDSYWILE